MTEIAEAKKEEVSLNSNADLAEFKTPEQKRQEYVEQYNKALDDLAKFSIKNPDNRVDSAKMAEKIAEKFKPGRMSPDTRKEFKSS